MAMVSPGARLADDVEVGPYCVVGEGVTLAAGVAELDAGGDDQGNRNAADGRRALRYRDGAVGGDVPACPGNVDAGQVRGYVQRGADPRGNEPVGKAIRNGEPERQGGE